MKNRRFKDEKRKGEKGKDKRTMFASFTSIAGGRKIAYTPYSDMVLYEGLRNDGKNNEEALYFFLFEL